MKIISAHVGDKIQNFCVTIIIDKCKTLKTDIEFKSIVKNV